MADSSSTSAFISTLIIYGLTAVVFVWLFLLLRPKNRRVYEPRSLKDIQTIPEEERTEPVPEGYFGWVEYLLETALVSHPAHKRGRLFSVKIYRYRGFTFVCGLFASFTDIASRERYQR